MRIAGYSYKSAGRLRCVNRYRKVLLASSYLLYFGEGLLGPLYAVFAQRIGGDILELTGAYALYLITMGVLSIYIGEFTNPGSRKHLMVMGYGMNAVATFGYLFVDSPPKLFLVQGALGVAAALATPTWNSLFSMHDDEKRTGRGWGLDAGGSNITLGLAAVAGGFIMANFGFTTLFLLMGIVQIASTLVLIND